MNGIWQGDCCDQVLRSFDYAASPSSILNITGPELLSVRWIAHRFGQLFGKQVKIAGQENGKAYLSNASKANSLFGNPSVPVGKIIEWIADWIQRGGEISESPPILKLRMESTKMNIAKVLDFSGRVSIAAYGFRSTGGNRWIPKR